MTLSCSYRQKWSLLLPNCPRPLHLSFLLASSLWKDERCPRAETRPMGTIRQQVALFPPQEAKENILWGAVRARASPTQPTDDLIMARRQQNILGVRKSPHKCGRNKCNVRRPQQITDHCAPTNGRNATMGYPRAGSREHQVCTGTQTWIPVHN